ncbi:trypsin-like serine protease [Ktedonosporobacter rubrisoli]|uniref:Trypsin-like serine protease n=1 Tax=Ktedonosporobacter rubrisoli TaxID=2509675 RepID=A0A4P6JXR8_KTERU|nr:trypsin-like peptidase domain-containing protein [Ktedonosporobacter rubrisoli]QBD80559.1 trypsin-like serine protease [Ktedonosporobacter rubrisoli]
MSGTDSIDFSLRRRLRLPSLLLLAGLICACIFATFSNIATAHAASHESTPGGNIADPVVRAVDIAKPAVVRILTQTSGQLSVHFPSGDVTFPQGNQTTYQLTLSGSGTFISSKGDILTADHVVNPPDQALQERAAPDVANYINQNPKLGLPPASPDQTFQALASGQLKSTAKYGPKQSEAFLSTDYTGPLAAQNLSTIPDYIHASIDKIEKESAVDQRDVAIVHAAFGLTDTPSVQLGDSSGVQQQDVLTIIGFPGNGDVSNRPTDLFTSSVNKINVSSIKTTDNGAPLIQVGGNVEQGDSGGPALDNNGNIVGIVSFGAASGGSTNFLQASSSARELVQALNLDTKPGSFQALWNEAFTNYASKEPGHWHLAQQQFAQLNKKYPQFKAIMPYLTYTQQQAKMEPASTAVPNKPQPPATRPTPQYSQPAMLWTGIGVGAIVLLVLLLFGAISLGRRRKAKRSAELKKAEPFAAAPSVSNPGPPQPGRQAQTNAGVASASGMQQGQLANAAPSPSAPQPGPQPAQTMQPPAGAQPVPPAPSMPTPTGSFTTLRVWPCGHMNRPNARFCSICGEPAPSPTTRLMG